MPYLQLAYGLVSWATRGLFVGERHVYAVPQIDDLFLASTIYTGGTYRITDADMQALADWQAQARTRPLAASLRLSWAANGSGSQSRPGDPLTAKAVALGGDLRLDQPHLGSPDPRQPDVRRCAARVHAQRHVPARAGVDAVRVGECRHAQRLGAGQRRRHARHPRRRHPADRGQHLDRRRGQPVAERRALERAAAHGPRAAARADQRRVRHLAARRVDCRVPGRRQQGRAGRLRDRDRPDAARPCSGIS